MTDQAATLRKISWRLIPFMAVLYFFNYLDRVNVGFAALTMNQDLSFSPSIYGTGAGVLFVGYFLLQIPSNFAIERFGVRRVIAPIMVIWGLVSSAMIFVSSPTEFYVLRFFLGAAEAGFFPGMVLYLTYWFPASTRGRIAGAFMLAIPVSSVLGAPFSTALLGIDSLGLKGWQWLFIVQGVPAIFLGCLVPFILTDRPERADWLSEQEKSWLIGKLAAEKQGSAPAQASFYKALLDLRIWLLALIYFSIVTGLYATTLWLPQIFKELGDLTNVQVGLLAALPYAFAALAMYFWGLHSDTTQERVWHLALPALLAAVGFAASAYVTVPALSFVALAIGAVGIYAALPVFWTLSTMVLAGASAAGCIALINAIGNAGGFFGPALVGYVREQTHTYSAALFMLGAFALLAGALALVIGRSTRVV